MIDVTYNYRQGDIHVIEMRTAYKAGFKDSVALIKELQDE